MSSFVTYCRNTKKFEAEMGIELDGEILEGDSTIANADLENGDVLFAGPAGYMNSFQSGCTCGSHVQLAPHLTS
jgi:hypothetical protein